MGVGDEILAAGQAEHLFAADSSRRVSIIDTFNRPRWHPIWDGNPILARPEDVARGERVQTLLNAPDARPYIVYPFTAQTGWTFNRSFHARDNPARIYLTDDEDALGAATREAFGAYVLVEPWSKHANLRWPLQHWYALVAARPQLTFVQHVHAESVLLNAPNVRHVAATFRQAVALVKHSLVYIRGESGMLHAAAAVRKRSIAIWGGCMDWDVLGGYEHEYGVGISTPPCGKWLPCVHCAQIMLNIQPSAVLTVLDELGVE